MKVGGFLRDTAILTSGTAFAQFLPFLIYPLLGRLYTPEQFTILATFTAIVSIIQVVSTGKYEMAILISDTDKDAANTFALSLLLCLCLSVFLYVVLLVGGNTIDTRFNFGLGGLLYLCPVSAFAICVFNCYNEWCVRKKNYPSLAANKITNAALVSGGKLGGAFTAFKSIGLVLGDSVGRILTAIVCFVRLFLRDRGVFKSVSFSEVWRQAKSQKEFPLYNMPSQLLNTLGGSLPVLILVNYFAKEEVGQFSMTMAILAVPISVVSVSIKDVYRQKVNEIYNNGGSTRGLFMKILGILSAISIVVASVFYFFLPKLFTFFLGAQWGGAGHYAQILLPMIVVDFIAMSLYGVLLVVKALRALFVWQVVYFLSTILALVLGCMLFDSLTKVLTLFCFVRLLVYLYMIILSYHYSR